MDAREKQLVNHLGKICQPVIVFVVSDLFAKVIVFIVIFVIVID